MKSPDCSRVEGEVKHQNGGTKKVFLENKLSTSALIISSQQETVISPTSPILNHDDAEENCHEMVIIQSDKSTGIIQGGNQLVTKSMAQLWPHSESW